MPPKLWREGERDIKALDESWKWAERKAVNEVEGYDSERREGRGREGKGGREGDVPRLWWEEAGALELHDGAQGVGVRHLQTHIQKV